MIVDLEHPRLQVFVNEDVEAQDLEAVPSTFAPPSAELDFLLDQLKWLHGEQTFLAHFADLLEKAVCVDAVLVAKLLQ